MKTKLPKAKTTEIVEYELDEELMLYDLATNKAYTLNKTLKIVYKSCNGKETFDDLKRHHKFTDDLIYFSLDKLKTSGLLEEYVHDHFGNLSRREIIKKVGLSSMIALPVISSLIAPTSASAASGRGTAGYFQACQTDDDCSVMFTCQNSSNAQGGTSRVCCNTRFGNFNRRGPGVPAGVLVFGNCGACGSIDPVQEDICCSQYRRYSGTCNPNSDGTVNCSYVCT
jgi:hypothetical protein